MGVSKSITFFTMSHLADRFQVFAQASLSTPQQTMRIQEASYSATQKNLKQALKEQSDAEANVARIMEDLKKVNFEKASIVSVILCNGRHNC